MRESTNLLLIKLLKVLLLERTREIRALYFFSDRKVASIFLICSEKSFLSCQQIDRDDNSHKDVGNAGGQLLGEVDQIGQQGVR